MTDTPTTARRPAVSIILLQWNRADDTIACLESLMALRYRNFRIVLVDNGSLPAELDRVNAWIRQASSLPGGGDAARIITILPLTENKGFALGNNIGIRRALTVLEPQYVWILNTDTRVAADSLDVLVGHLESHETTGAVQPLLLRDAPGSVVDSLGIRLMKDASVADDGQETAWIPGQEGVREIFGCCAASMLVRAAVLRKIGLFDPWFFAIFEDADFAFRLRIAGWNAALLTTAVVYHKRGISGRKEAEPPSLFSMLLKHRNATALRMRYWPARLFFFSSGTYKVAAKALLLAFRHHRVAATLWLWLRSLFLRYRHRGIAREIFGTWAA
jgi:GT2 family glycosyltransferase